MEQLFSKEDIEKFGFLYESDSTKCKMHNIGIHYDCNYYKDGKWTNQTTPAINDEWRKSASEIIRVRMNPTWKYIHSVFVLSITPQEGQGVMCRRVYIRGH